MKVAKMRRKRFLRLRWWQWLLIGLGVLLVIAAPFAISLAVTYINVQAAATDFALPTVTVAAGEPTPTPKPALSSSFDFSQLGSFGFAGLPDFSRPSTQADAQKKLSFPLQMPAYVPQGFTRAANMNVLKRIGASFTPDIAKIQAYLRNQNIALDIPTALDHKRITAYVGDLIFVLYNFAPNANTAVLTGKDPAAMHLTVAVTDAPELDVPPDITRADILRGIAQLPIPANEQLPILYAQWSLIDPDNVAPLALPSTMTTTPVNFTANDGTPVQARIYRDTLKGDADMTWQRGTLSYIVDGYITDAELVKIAASFS